MKKVVGKRTKVSKTRYTTSPDAHFGVDLNNEDEFELEEVVRPMGRDMTIKKGSSLNPSGVRRGVDIQKADSSFEIYNLNLETHLNFEKEKLNEKKKAQEPKQRAREETQRMYDMNFLIKPFDHLTDNELDMILRVRTKIMKKYYN